MRHCLFSISYAGFWGQDVLSLSDFIAKAGALGFDGVMLAGKRPHLSPLDADDQLCESLQRQLAAAGLRCDVIAAYTDFGPQLTEVPTVEFQIAYVEQLARLARRLDTSIIRVFTAYEHPQETPLACWQRLTSVFREMSDRAAPHGVTLAIQNHHDVPLATPALVEFLTDIDRPNCKLGFDAWSPALRGEDLYQSAQLAAPYSVITTNADYVQFPRYQYHPELINYSRCEVDMVRAVPFGEGFIDYDAFFSGLREGGFDGVATYEMCAPLRGGGSLDNLDRCASRYLDWIRRRERRAS